MSDTRQPEPEAPGETADESGGTFDEAQSPAPAEPSKKPPSGN